ncbi:hypothetical protein ACO0LM_10085 [Undibacterium sp. Di26W]|uniref:hypothetical protein n=1 Tax=Undibacterium sp. Di26W TaxID=3413035 RepID=UPI003BF2B0EC
MQMEEMNVVWLVRQMEPKQAAASSQRLCDRLQKFGVSGVENGAKRDARKWREILCFWKFKMKLKTQKK